MLLADGDCTKREAILWSVTIAEAGPYLERCLERRLADQAVLGVLGIKLPWLTPKADDLPVNQPIGHACGGKLVGACSPFYGDKLHVACWSCPGLN